MIDNIISSDIEEIKNSLSIDFSGKEVLVTGGAGFIGSWLCDTLAMLGSEITVIDNLSTGRMQNIDHLSKRLTFVNGDVGKFKIKKNFDLIFHMAAHASPDEYQVHPIETLATSSSGTVMMAELARKNDATLLFASTSEVYGDAEVVPTPEDYYGKVNPVGPRSCYDEGKRYAEALLMAYGKEYGLDVRVPRIFNSYGPRLREDGLYGRAMSRFIMQALSDKPITVYGEGKQTRSFCYIADTITGLMLVATSKACRGEIVNLGNNCEISILELAKKIVDMTKCKSILTFYPLPQDDPRRRCPQISKVEMLARWKPKVRLEEGLKKTIEWFSLGYKMR